MSCHTRLPWKNWRGPTISRANWVAAVILVVGLVAALSHLSGTTVDYSRYNPEWNGTSLFFRAMEDRGAAMVANINDLKDTGNGLFLVMAPEGELPVDEVSTLRLFMSGGNTLVLVSDRDDDNALLAGLGSSIRIREANVTSADRYYDHPASVLAFPSGDDPLGMGIPRIVTNSPSYLEGGEPVFETSILTWVDADGNSRMSRGEVLRRYTVIAVEEHGNGSLYVISDPSIFINGMLAPGPGDGNAALADRIATLKPRTWIEQGRSQTASAPPMIRVVNLVKESTISKMAIITLVSLLASLSILKRRGQAP